MKTLYKYALALMVFCAAFTNITWGQTAADINTTMLLQTQYTSPSTPEVASLGKFGDYQVNNFTGGLNISIPLIGLDDRGFGYSIGLNYDGSGNKVETLPSWVGLGWSLTGVPVISRSVVGRPDFKDNYYDKSAEIILHQTESANYLERQELMRDIECGRIEAQSDIYNISLPTGSIKFYIRADQTVVLAEQKDYEVNVSFSTGQLQDIDRIIVRDPMGNVYTFDQREYTEVTLPDTGVECNYSSSYTYTSAFYCSKIVSYTHDEEILFAYDTEGIINGEIFNQINQDNYVSKKYTTSNTTNCQSCNQVLTTQGGAEWETVYERRFLKSVTLNSGGEFTSLINFISSPNNSQYKRQFDRKLDAIFFNKASTKYWVSFDYTQDKRLKLSSIQKNDADGNVSDKYSFTYNSRNLPGLLSNSLDFLGYYNGAGNSSSLIPSINGQGGGANRDPNLTYCKAGILEKITYPTGGYSSFDFELHSDGNEEYGGLRLANASTYDIDDKLILSKDYSYGKNRSSGVVFNPISFKTEESFTTYQVTGSPPTSSSGNLPCADGVECTSKIFYSVNKSRYSAINGAFMGYELVIESLTDAQGKKGSTQYIYDIDFDNGLMDNPRTGNLLDVKVYNQEDQLLVHTENIYTDPVSFGPTFTSYGIEPMSNQSNKVILCPPYGFQDWSTSISGTQTCYRFNTRYKYGVKLKVKTHRNFLEKSIVQNYTYDNGVASVKTTTDYVYDEDLFNNKPKEVIVTDENGISKSTKITYPKVGVPVLRNFKHLPTEILVNDGAAGGSKMEYEMVPFSNGTSTQLYKPKRFFSARADGSWKLVNEVLSYAQDIDLPMEIFSLKSVANATLDYFSGSKNRLLHTSILGARTNTYSYDNLNRLSNITDFNGIQSNYDYDGFGRLTYSDSQNGRITNAVTYNQSNSNGGENIISSEVAYPQDGNIPKLTYESIFDGIGRGKQEKKLGYAQSGGDYISSSEYNGLNGATKVNDPGSGGETINTYEKSPLNRMLRSKPAGSQNETIQVYGTNSSAIGGYAPNTLNKVSITDENGQISATYTDIFGRQIATVTDEGGLNLMTTYTYNDRDQVLTIQPPGGGEQYIYTYYPDGLLHTKSIPDKGVHTYTYNQQDQVLTETQPDGDVLSYIYHGTYNEFLERVRLNGSTIKRYVMEGNSGWVRGEATKVFEDSGTSYLWTYYRNYDDIGRVGQERRNYLGGQSLFNYTYDDAGNVTNTIRNHNSSLGSINSTITNEFDKGIRQVNSILNIAGLSNKVFEHTYDDREWLQTKVLGDGLQSIDYDYNPRGWLTQINSVESTIPDYEPCTETDDPALCDCLGPYSVQDLNVFYNCLELTTGEPTNVSVTLTSSIINGANQTTVDQQTFIIPFNSGTYEPLPEYSEVATISLGGGIGTGQNGGGQNGGGAPNNNIDPVLFQILDCIRAAGGQVDPNDLPNGESPLTGDIGALQYAIYDALDITQAGTPSNLSDQAQNLFGMEIHYFDGNPELNAPNQYNGNISWVEWGNYREPVQRYGYNYDGANRLLSAKYEAEKLETCEKVFEGAYDVSINGYDDRGNIMGITRNGILRVQNNVPVFGIIDDLQYTYGGNSNLLNRVTNSNGVTDYGFNSSVANYLYEDGNLKYDSGKNISDISYNYMDMPLKIDIAGGTVYNSYDADGNKLKSRIVSTDPEHESVTYDYMGGIEYKDGALEAQYHEEGRFVFDNVNGNHFEYFLKDHLGNTRVRFADKDNNGSLDVELVEVQDENGETTLEHQEYLGAKSYYPFGLAFSHNSVATEDGDIYWIDQEGGTKNKYTYNGKEFLDNLDIGLHDYGFRYYDPATARFTTIDPLAESNSYQSGYAYADNNPIKFIDFMGLNSSFNWTTGSHEDTGRGVTDTYGVDKDGNISKIDDKKYTDSEGNEVDKLVRTNSGAYKTDKNGKIKLDNINVRRGVLKQGLNKRKLVSGTEFTTISTGSDDETAQALFEFLGSKTAVEWSVVKTSTSSGKGGLNRSSLFSSHENDKEQGSAAYLESLPRGTRLVSHTHNHPDSGKMGDESRFSPSGSDRKFAKRIHSTHPNAILRIFYQGKYSRYDQDR